MTRKPIFIVGTMRSGSTLFRLVLDAHPDIAIGEETGFMGAVAATRSIPAWQHGPNWFTRLGWSEQEFDERLHDFYAGLFERFARSQGKSRWGEKTPFHSQYVLEMARLFPEAVFVAIVRHPGAVVHSLASKFHHGVGEAAAYWERTNADLLRHGAELGGDRFALVRYEDLVLNSETVLRELMDWLDEPWSEDLLRHNDIQAARGAPRMSAGSTRTRDPITASVSSRWVQALSAPELAQVVSATGALARLLGYDPALPTAPTPVPSPGRPELLVTGSVLRELRRAHPDHPAFTPRADEVLLPEEADPAELARRLRQAERALARIRSRRAVRWVDSAQKARRVLGGLPAELARRSRRGGR